MSNLASYRLYVRPARSRAFINLCLMAAFIVGITLSTHTASAQHLRARGDYDGEGRTDLAVYRPSEANWYIRGMMFLDFQVIRNWGAAGDVLVPGDYDNDALADFAVWRASEGNWYILNSSDNSVTVKTWGAGSLGDVPVPADYDNDGKADIAIYRPSEGNWYIINSFHGNVTTIGWGVSGDIPVPGDYDGDRRADIAVWRPSNGTWYILNSTFGIPGWTTPRITQVSWGESTDVLVPEDYDGDFITDIAVWRPSEGNWYIRNSKTNTVTQRSWGGGSLNDIPVPGDYDDDFKADLAVWRPSEGNWYIIMSGSGDIENGGSAFVFQWGGAGDVPVVASHLPQ